MDIIDRQLHGDIRDSPFAIRGDHPVTNKVRDICKFIIGSFSMSQNSMHVPDDQIGDRFGMHFRVIIRAKATVRQSLQPEYDVLDVLF